MVTIEEQKKNAAHAAVDAVLVELEAAKYKNRTIVLGIGSGSTIVPAVSKLSEALESGSVEGLTKETVVCIPTSFQSKLLITENGLRLGSLEQFPKLDCAIDGADDCDANLNLIKGGGGCQTLEKIIAYSAKTFYVVCDQNKNSEKLFDWWKKGIPIEVIPESYKMIQNVLKEKIGATSSTLRLAKSKAGPVVTDNGNFIIDAVVETGLDLKELESELKAIPGVVCTGLFIEMAQKAFFGNEDGSVTVKSKTADGSVNVTTTAL